MTWRDNPKFKNMCNTYLVKCRFEYSPSENPGELSKPGKLVKEPIKINQLSKGNRIGLCKKYGKYNVRSKLSKMTPLNIFGRAMNTSAF